MNKLFRALIAGYGAKKLGGGCFSTILIFVLLYWLLGQCNGQSFGQTRARQHYYLFQDK
ncbi:hypothetical protein [Desertivirga brevis]|uniref:hypothetical protein n=1 Tax=Desertivirga brevis TaxID=2810310 RepID=UPI001A95970D|nr:hypothetical protein [Pedobacter sp. SYSU D00873]